MLNLPQFKKRLQSTHSALRVRVAIDTKNSTQFYLIDMVASGELIKIPDEEILQSCGYKFLLLTLTKNLPPIRHNNLSVKPPTRPQ
jgi:hypothetical protein